jgi:hypothetical protein
MTPMLANIVGPPSVRDQDQGFHRRLPFRGVCSAFGNLVM